MRNAKCEENDKTTMMAIYGGIEADGSDTRINK
jgi:hypothetical protein